MHPHDATHRCDPELMTMRQYFPKEMVLTDVPDKQVQWAVDRLNHRPRKVFRFRSPHEVFFRVEMRYTKIPLAVALQT